MSHSFHSVRGQFSFLELQNILLLPESMRILLRTRVKGAHACERSTRLSLRIKG
jgi:hypothetical protein